MTDENQETSLAVLKQVWRRRVFRLSVVLGVIAGGATALGGAGAPLSIAIGVALAVLGALLDLIGMLEHHDMEASIHYGQARTKYETIERYQARLIITAIHDIEELINQMNSDVRRIVSRPNESDLFTKLIALDLEVLRDRLSKVKTDDTLTLDTHQARSHVLICEVIAEEHLGQIWIIYDLRDRKLGFHEIDWYFADEVDRLIKSKATSMQGLFILNDSDFALSHDNLLENISDRSDLAKLFDRYQSPGYELKLLSNKTFQEICQKLYPGVESACDIGIYGKRYVYVGTGSVSSTNIPRGEWKRAKSIVDKYSGLYERCWKDAQRPTWANAR